MNSTASDQAISDLSDNIKRRMGIHFPRERWNELKRKVAMAADYLGFPDDASCIRWALSSDTDKQQGEILASCLTGGETYFYRENRSLRALAERAFPEMVRAHAGRDRRIRIWSAGCGSGEEAYTLAMMVREYPGFSGWDVGILGTDINQAVLMKAEAGLYSAWSFCKVEPSIRKKYFMKKGFHSFEVAPELREMVSFSHLNLIDDPYPALMNRMNAIDLIMCRNVLMYFSPDRALDVMRKFREALLPEGWLLVGGMETALVDTELFMPLWHEGAILHRKAGERMEKQDADAETIPSPQAVTSEPEGSALDRTALFQCARDFYHQGNYDGAIALLGLLASRPGAEAPVFMYLARSCARKGMLEEAEEWCLRAVGLNGNNAVNYHLLAKIRKCQQASQRAQAPARAET